MQEYFTPWVWIAAFVIAFYFLYFKKPNTEPRPIETRKDPITLEELAKHTQPPSIWISVRGRVFDVTSGAAFYGPSGPYSLFAGRDATIGLARGVVSLDGDVPEKLTQQEEQALKEWEELFERKYSVVGVLAK